MTSEAVKLFLCVPGLAVAVPPPLPPESSLCPQDVLSLILRLESHDPTLLITFMRFKY